MIRTHRESWLVAFAAVAVALAAGCSKEGVRPEEKPALMNGYTCCNFHYDKDWINDGNYAQLPMIPVGSPIKVTDYGRYRAHVEIDGKPFRLGLDYGRERETTEQWVAKLIVRDDPKARLAGYPAAVRKTIQSGQVMIGMTKEQVIMALGYPLTNENPRLDAPYWRYWWSSFGEYHVHWNGGGRVSGVTGNPDTVMLMLAPGNAATAASAVQEVPAVPPPAMKSDNKTQGTKTDGKAKPSNIGR